MSLTPPPPGLAAVQARPLKRAAPRFLGDEGSDNEADVAWKGLEGLANKRTTAEDVDWLFADLDRDMSDDDDEALPAPMDRSAFAEQDKRIADGKAKAAAQAAAAIIDDSITGGRARGKGRGRAGAAQEGDEGEDGEKKSRKKAQPRAKIDEARLMGDRGFRKLRDNLKGFKIKGKGHEDEDLRRLMTVYQLWAHQLFPRLPFRSTIEGVERVCLKKGMKYELDVLKDEAKGIFRNKADQGATSDAQGEGNDRQPAGSDDDHPDVGITVRYRTTDGPSTSQAGSPLPAGPKRSHFDNIPTSSPGGALSYDAEMRELDDDEDLVVHSQPVASTSADADIFFTDTQKARHGGTATIPRPSTTSEAGFNDNELTFDLDDDDFDEDAEAELAMMEMEDRRPAVQLSKVAATRPPGNPASIVEDNFDDYDFGDEEDILREMEGIADPAPKPRIPASATSVSSGPDLDFDDDMLEEDEDFMKSIEETDENIAASKKVNAVDTVRGLSPIKIVGDPHLHEEEEEDLYS